MENTLSSAIYDLSNWSQYLLPLITGTILIFGLGLLLHNVFATGKKGWGWVVLLMLLGIMDVSGDGRRSQRV